MPKNTSNAQFGQVLSEIWPAEVFWSQNSCGRAQTDRDVRQRKLVVRRRVLVARRRVPKVRKLWKAISHSKLVQIGCLRRFLASIGKLDAKKHLKRPIRTSFEWDMASRSFLVSKLMWAGGDGSRRATTQAGRATTGLGRAQTGPKSQKTLEGYISLKTCPNWAFEAFFGIYRKCRCHETPQRPIWTSFEWDMAYRSFLVSKLMWAGADGSRRATTGPKSQETLEGHISLTTCWNRVFEVFFGIY